MDKELQEIIEKYKTTFQANIKPANFKRLIFKYLKLKYNEYVIVYYRHITERMRSDKKTKAFFRVNIWTLVQKKLNLEQSPTRSSAATPPEEEFYY